MPKQYHSEDYGTLQELIDKLFAEKKHVTKVELIVRAESVDLCADLLEICERVPAGTYSRRHMCDQINSSLIAHGWGSVYGTVE